MASFLVYSSFRNFCDTDFEKFDKVQKRNKIRRGGQIELGFFTVKDAKSAEKRNGTLIFADGTDLH
jgi:hypothetical protein